ncbi:flagellar biosynthesis protein FliL [Halorhodospira halochloris]|uniref:Flagellar protein FliL n=1 Tax=Halorhodospira halochloris TaxID=1052 RepID=A0A0X8X825_HALHR|nr:flagellar basal body-associated FliL family protein [Halorhodospira halochloris]MBK1651522.1 hypothetical protein [Halorhodospira halochloris]BAU57214.1 flagellar biosynthesis protein FliL [Halorhodospira halochloris]
MPKSIYVLLTAATVLLTITLGFVLAIATGWITPPGMQQYDSDPASTEVDYDDAQYVELEPSLTVNFGDGERLRYLEADVQVQTSQDEVVEALERHSAAIRDELIMLFSEQSPEDLNDVEGREELRNRSEEIINGILEKRGVEGRIDDVFFTEFVMQ